MTNLAIQEISKEGLDPSFGAADAAGDEFLNDDRTFLVVKNADASSHTATITAQRTSFDIGNFGAVDFTDIAVAVPAGGERWIAAPPPPYNDGSGKAQVTYDAVTSVTVAAVRLPRL